MNVMYVCDDYYAMIAGISILSLLDNNQDIDHINVFLIADAISECNLVNIKRSIEAYHRNLVILKKPDIKKLLGCDIKVHRWCDNIFTRVFLCEVFKDYSNIEKLIYIDCDTLINGSLQDLWDIDLEKCIGAGVCEAMGNLHKKAIGLHKEDNYYNSGVLLIDLQKWKEADVDAKAAEFVRKKEGRLEYPDEGILNGVLSKDIKKLSPKYNLTSLSIYFNSRELRVYRKSYINYSERERQEALADARIIHFTSTYLDVRPWVEGCCHPYADKWLEYKGRSLWKEEPLMKDTDLSRKLVRKLALWMPKWLRLLVTGILHAYVKPCKFIFK